MHFHWEMFWSWEKNKNNHYYSSGSWTDEEVDFQCSSRWPNKSFQPMSISSLLMIVMILSFNVINGRYLGCDCTSVPEDNVTHLRQDSLFVNKKAMGWTSREKGGQMNNGKEALARLITHVVSLHTQIKSTFTSLQWSFKAPVIKYYFCFPLEPIFHSVSFVFTEIGLSHLIYCVEPASSRLWNISWVVTKFWN